MPDVTTSYERFSSLIGSLVLVWYVISSSNFYKFWGMKIISMCHHVCYESVYSIKVNICRHLWLRQSSFYGIFYKAVFLSLKIWWKSIKNNIVDLKFDFASNSFYPKLKSKHFINRHLILCGWLNLISLNVNKLENIIA